MENFRNPAEDNNDNKEEKNQPAPENNEPGNIGFETGNDMVEMSMEEGEKIVYGSTFSPKDGDSGDETEDNGDLPSALKKNKNAYDETISGAAEAPMSDTEDELKRGIHIANEDEIGMAYGEDKYTSDKDDENNSEEPEGE
jgi:hypothetical protein